MIEYQPTQIPSSHLPSGKWIAFFADGGHATVSFVRGEVSGPGHSGAGCDPEDFSVGGGGTAEGSVRVTEIDGPNLYGEVILDDAEQPLLSFHATTD